MHNTLWLNPAYAGSRDVMTVTGIYRSQWVNFDGAPQDQSITLHAPIMSRKGGIGLSVINDKIGPVKSTWIAADFAYHIRLNSKSKLALGLKGMVNLYTNNLSSLKLDEQADISFSKNVQSVLPNAGAGIYYYRNRFYAGVSSPRLIENKLTSSAYTLSKEQRHYFFITGFVVDLSKNVVLKPTVFVKATFGAPIEGDATATFIFSNKLDVGINYRTGDALCGLVGFNITDQLYVGYSYDWSFANTTGKYNSGSHEIMLRYDLIYKGDKKIKSPRYF